MNTQTSYNAGDAGARFQGTLRKHRKGLIITGILLVLAIVLVSECTFVVGEAEQAVISRFGVITRIIINDHNDFHDRYQQELQGEISLSKGVSLVRASGLQFKLPFVDKAEIYSARLYTYTSSSETVNTSEKKQYNITTYAQWAITDPALFSLKLGSMTSAENQLDNLIHPVIVQAINHMVAEDFVSNKDALNQALAHGLSVINQSMAVRGIEVKDIQVHRTILPSANLSTTYARMQADREKVAQQLRSEGEEAYQMAVADADLQARVIEANAISEAGRIRGEGDAQALEIYANGYAQDAEFYSFWRSLQALKTSVTGNATLILDKEHPLVKQLLDWGFAGN